jgi:hypothetical protein
VGFFNVALCQDNQSKIIIMANKNYIGIHYADFSTSKSWAVDFNGTIKAVSKKHATLKKHNEDNTMEFEIPLWYAKILELE